MELIRILHVVPNMQAGGLESFIMNIYRNINRNKVQFDFLYHYEGKYFFDDEIKSMGGKIYNFSIRQDNNIKRYIDNLNDFFKNHREYKIIHSHMPSLAFIHLKIAKKHGISLRIIHSHNSSVEKNFKGTMKSMLIHYSVKYANYRFACSVDSGKYLYNNKDFDVINNAIDVPKFLYNTDVRKQIRNKMNLDGKFVIGHIGRFVLQKNHLFLIDIFKEILKRKSNSILLLVGDGSMKFDVQKKVDSLGISENVIFYGVTNDIENILQAMDVFVLPSLFEGLGIVLIEAQASGLKCFTSKDVVPKEAKVSENLEYISLSKTSSYWCEEILKYDEGYLRENMYNEVCNHDYDIEKVANKLENFYINSLN